MLAPRSATSYAGEHQRRAVLRQLGVAIEPTPLMTDRAAYVGYLERQLETTVSACMQLHSLEARVAQLSAACARQEERTVAMARLMKCQQAMFEEHEGQYRRANEALTLRVHTLEQALGRSPAATAPQRASPTASVPAAPPAADAAVTARFRDWAAEQHAAAAALEERLASRLAAAGAAAEAAAEAAATRAVSRAAASAAAAGDGMPLAPTSADGIGAAAATVRELRTRATLAAAAVPPTAAAAVARNTPLAAAVPGWGHAPRVADVAALHREGLVDAAARAAAPPAAAQLVDAARDAEARRRRLAAMFAELAPGAAVPPLPRSF